LNLFDHYWPSLLQIPGFILQFITPIVKVTKGAREICFYTIPEYQTWLGVNADGKGWGIKYYKGLGTSTAKDAKGYFSDMNRHVRPFARAVDEDRVQLDLAFSKKKADERKEWLSGYVPGTFIDTNVSRIPIREFVGKELILHCMADNVRSIPSVIDGLKPGVRKIIFACIKRNLVKGELKVAQLAGYVGEVSAYHHGEVSLAGSIVGLAYSHVGSNNLNLLEPLGQFGTRLQGGKDHAAARYIFTRLSEMARMIYHPLDDALVKYRNEEGMSIEPDFYVPVVPMVLINGSEGIGTGWSSFVFNYCLGDVVGNLLRKIDGMVIRIS
jgi:DNA topoisomerase-2